MPLYPDLCLLPYTPVARRMSSPSIDSSPPTEKSCSGSPNLSNSERKATKDSTGCFCCSRSSRTVKVIDNHNKPFNCSAPDCKRTQGFASLTSLSRHETETHGMHNRGQKFHCPIPTCERHNGKGFQRNEQLENHTRLKHPNDGDNLGRCLKRKADVDWDENLQDIKHLRDNTRDLRNQFAEHIIGLWVTFKAADSFLISWTPLALR
jgi:hypothetical protein